MQQNREEKCGITLAWYQLFWITTVGSLSNKNGDDNKDSKKATGLC